MLTILSTHTLANQIWGEIRSCGCQTLELPFWTVKRRPTPTKMTNTWLKENHLYSLDEFLWSWPSVTLSDCTYSLCPCGSSEVKALDCSVQGSNLQLRCQSVLHLSNEVHKQACGPCKLTSKVKKKQKRFAIFCKKLDFTF